MNKKSFFFIIVMAFAVNTTFAQLLVENFNYPVGDSVSAHNGWTGHSGAGTNPILVGAPGLEFPGYIVTGGNAALVYNTGQDINKTFDSLTAGSVYTSMLIKVTAALPAPGYFFHYGRNPFNTFDFRARTWLKLMELVIELVSAHQVMLTLYLPLKNLILIQHTSLL